MVARSSSSEGSAASALIPFTSRTVSPIAPPTISNLSCRLGEIDRHLGGRDGVFGRRKRGRALEKVADRLVARVLERNQGKSVLRNFELGAGVAHLQTQVRGLRHGQTEIAGDDHHARLGEDLLQLGDQIGFLRTIHANSKNSSGSLRTSFNKSSRRTPEH